MLGVIDLVAGRAVHARGGQREGYAPVRAVAGSPIAPGDALALAWAYVNRLGLAELYAADLDAIMGRLRVQSDPSARRVDDPSDRPGGTGCTSQDALVARLAACGAPLWLDAGVSSVHQAHHALGLGAARVVVGLETLSSYDALREICAVVGRDRVAFSLDLRDGKPVFAAGAGCDIPSDEPAHLVAARAADAGVGTVVAIDLARVGSGAGLDLGMIACVRAAVPGLALLAGGGVRGLDDCTRLADCGCDGALVATALHDGRLDAAAVAAAGRHTSPTR